MKIRLTIIMLLLSFTFAAQKTDLTDVKVYTSGAFLKHNAKINLKKGKNKIVLENLSKGILDKTIEISLSGNNSILTVDKKFNYLTSSDRNPEIKSLELKLKDLKLKITQFDNRLKILQFEETLLSENMKVGGDKGTTVQDVKNMAKFASAKLKTIYQSRTEIALEKESLFEKIKKIEAQLNELKQKFSQPIEEVHLEIFANKNNTSELTLSYMINNAGWIPNYDLRVKDTNSDMNLVLKAGVWQNSGLDWKNVNITLSTNRPQYQSKPELHPWYVDFIQEMKRFKKSVRLQAAGKNEAAEMDMAMAPVALDEEQTSMYFEANENTLSMEFTPSINFDVPSDRKKHYLILNEYKLKTEYSHYSVPKLSKAVYLIAKTKDISKTPMLPGEMTMYFENSYVGPGYFNPVNASEDYSISLGEDKNVKIERKTIKDFTEDKFLSSDVERFFGYEIKVLNNKSEKINLTIEENIPLSKQEDIEISLIEKGKAVHSAKDGKLTWKMELEPKQKFEDSYKFYVRYPKDKKIRNL